MKVKRLEPHAASASLVSCRRGELAEAWRLVSAVEKAVHWIALAESGMMAARADDSAGSVLLGALAGGVNGSPFTASMKSWLWGDSRKLLAIRV